MWCQHQAHRMDVLQHRKSSTRMAQKPPLQKPTHQHTKKPKTPVIDWKWHNQQRREQIKMHPLHLLVHQFTREHTEHIENPDGTNEYVKVHSYLTQLEHAKNANRGTGTTSGGRSEER